MLSLKSPAKINWYLKVFNKRSDGFHNIESVMQTVSLFDDITIEPSSDIEVSMNPSLGIEMQDNIVYKTILKVKEITQTDKGAKVTIKKHIPAGAGLGGGSSNSATTLLALNNLWSLNLNRDKLVEVSQSIGSDIAFFLYSPTAIARGRGEVIEPLNIKHSYKLVIVKPDISISTAWAYNQLKRDGDYSNKSNMRFFINALIFGDLKSMRRYGVNDFEDVIFKKYKVLKEIKDGLLKVGASYAMMSGSGSCIYGVFRDDGYKVAYDFYSKKHMTWIVDTLNESVYNIQLSGLGNITEKSN